MQQPRKSIAARALFLVLWLLGLSLAAEIVHDSYARAEESVFEIAYSAPAGCPTKQQFEQRLRARLSGDARRLRGSLSLRLTQSATHTRGELTITSGPRIGARREVEAPRCEEAVDALTLVTALLIEPEQTQPAREIARRTGGSTRAASAVMSNRSSSADPPAQGSHATAAGDAEAHDEPVFAAPEGSADKAPALSKPVAPAAEQPKSTPPSSLAPAKTAPRAGSQSSLSLDLLAAALLATGTLPALRPGAEVRGSLARTWSNGLAAALELGARGLAPHRTTSPEGGARFAFFGGTAALCFQHRAARLGTSLCALAELARLSAQGRNIATPQRADVFWRALGPALRASLLLAPRWSIALGAELLLPLTRDSFELGGRELWRVPSLTFRGSLGVALRFE